MMASFIRDLAISRNRVPSYLGDDERDQGRKGTDDDSDDDDAGDDGPSIGRRL